MIRDSHHPDADPEQCALREYILVESGGEARHHDTQSKDDGSWYHEYSWTIAVKYSSNETTLARGGGEVG